MSGLHITSGGSYMDFSDGLPVPMGIDVWRFMAGEIDLEGTNFWELHKHPKLVHIQKAMKESKGREIIHLCRKRTKALFDLLKNGENVRIGYRWKSNRSLAKDDIKASYGDGKTIQEVVENLYEVLGTQLQKPSDPMIDTYEIKMRYSQVSENIGTAGGTTLEARIPLHIAERKIFVRTLRDRIAKDGKSQDQVKFVRHYSTSLKYRLQGIEDMEFKGYNSGVE